MYRCDVGTIVQFGILESVSRYSLGCLVCDEFDGLNYTRLNLMFDSRVFTLCILTNEN